MSPQQWILLEAVHCQQNVLIATVKTTLHESTAVDSVRSGSLSTKCIICYSKNYIARFHSSQFCDACSRDLSLVF